MRCLVLVPLLVVSTLTSSQTSQTDSQTLKALLEEVRLLRQDLHTTTVAAQRVQIALYRLQLQDAAVARAATLVEEARSKLTGLQDAHRHFVTEIEQLEHQRDQNQDFQERRQIEEDRLPRLRTTLEQLSHDEQQQRARLSEAEGQLKGEQIKLEGLHSLLDQLDQALGKCRPCPSQYFAEVRAGLPQLGTTVFRSCLPFSLGRHHLKTPPLSGHTQ